MATVETNSELGQQIVADAKRVRPPLVVGAGRGQPDPRRGRRGPLLLGLRRQALPRLRVAARQPLARAPAPEARRRRSRSRRTSSARSGRRWRREPRSTLARLLAEVTPGDLAMSFFTNGGAEANENAIKLARWYTGPAQGRSRATARTTARRPARSRSPATRAAGPPSPASRASCACSTRTRIAARPAIPIRARSARARRTSRRSSSTRAPHTVAAVIIETVTGTNGVIVAAGRLPAVDPRGLRPPRHRAHLRRGDGRLRPHGQVVRVRELGRRPGHPHRREGHQLRLRAARRDGHLGEARATGCATSRSPAG